MQKTWRMSASNIAIILILISATTYCFFRINYRFVDSAGDNYTYELIAQSVFTGEPFKVNVKFDYYDEHPIFHHQRSFPPLYPIFLAIGHLLFGQSIYVNFFLTSIIGVLCALPVYWLGLKLADNFTALLVAVLVVLSPELVHMSVLGMSEPLFCLMSLLMIFYVFQWLEYDNNKYLILTGFFCGLSFLTRANGLANIIAVLTFIIYAEREYLFANKKHRAINKIGLFLIALCLTTLPWLLRNYLVFGDPFYYVGRFSAAFTPGSSKYSGFVQSSTQLNNPVEFSSVAYYYINAFLLRGKILIKETHVFLIFALFELITGIKERRFYPFLLIYLLFNFAIALFAPYVKARHLINIFPVVYLLAVLFFRRIISKLSISKDNWFIWFKENTFSWRSLISVIFLVVFMVGTVKSVFNGLTFTKKIDFFSSQYVVVGEWLRKNSPKNSVVMSNKTTPVAYYTKRPALSLPTNSPPDKVDEIIDQYQVGYIVSSAYKGYIPQNFIKKMIIDKRLHKNQDIYESLIIYQRTTGLRPE